MEQKKKRRRLKAITRKREKETFSLSTVAVYLFVSPTWLFPSRLMLNKYLITISHIWPFIMHNKYPIKLFYWPGAENCSSCTSIFNAIHWNIVFSIFILMFIQFSRKTHKNFSIIVFASRISSFFLYIFDRFPMVFITSINLTFLCDYNWFNLKRYYY